MVWNTNSYKPVACCCKAEIIVGCWCCFFMNWYTQFASYSSVVFFFHFVRTINQPGSHLKGVLKGTYTYYVLYLYIYRMCVICCYSDISYGSQFACQNCVQLSLCVCLWVCSQCIDTVTVTAVIITVTAAVVFARTYQFQFNSSGKRTVCVCVFFCKCTLKCFNSHSQKFVSASMRVSAHINSNDWNIGIHT